MQTSGLLAWKHGIKCRYFCPSLCVFLGVSFVYSAAAKLSSSSSTAAQQLPNGLQTSVKDLLRNVVSVKHALSKMSSHLRSSFLHLLPPGHSSPLSPAPLQMMFRTGLQKSLCSTSAELALQFSRHPFSRLRRV